MADDTFGLGAGINGAKREGAISGYVDNAVSGGTKTPAADNTPPTLDADKQHPGLRESAAYKPSQNERATHVYGAPISAPVLSSGK